MHYDASHGGALLCSGRNGNYGVLDHISWAKLGQPIIRTLMMNEDKCPRHKLGLNP